VRERRIFLLVCAATLPAVVLGFALEHKLRDIFGTPALAAMFLIANGFILYAGEKIRHAGAKSLDQIGFGAALVIGACQALALIPGISRSGSTMVGGVLAGLTHKESARFSFLLATPIIAGAGVLEIPKMLKERSAISFDPTVVVVSGIVAGITAFISVVVLMRYFKKHEVEALKPFAYYCWIAGAIAFLLLS
jgi:undecaprenyl-diphosphatase